MALTPDAVSTNEELVETFLDGVYHPHKKQIWAAIVLLFAGILAYLGVRQYHLTRLDDMWTRYRDAAMGFELSAVGEVDTAAARKQIDALQGVVRDYPDESVTPFALQQLAKAQVAVGEFESALKTIDDLRTRFKDFPLNTLSAEPDADAGHSKSISQQFEDSIKRQRDWASKRTYVHHWPSDDRMALIETTAGSFWINFYSDPSEAPKHVESFIQHAKHGDYNGTQINTIIQSVEGTPERFEAGSKTSGLVDHGGVADPSEQDRDEPADTIEPEDTRSTIHHEYRVVSPVKMESGESATRFVVVTKRNGLEKLNGETSPFAAVMDREKSLETIDKIGRAQTYGSNPTTKDSAGVFRMRDQPYPAIYVRRVSIFSKEKLEDGHTWDTSRVGKDEAEPWEAGRKAPMPEEFTEKKAEPPK
jgi:cyclophilin family peptidyl-prolyl cis-trans isomerase/predicted negative regulator of RcsB-dependent stress response